MITRREWTKMAALWVASTWAPSQSSAFLQTPRFQSDPFALGVASGDPLPTGVVLWTRLFSDELRDNVEVDWEVSSDDQMRRIVQSGRAVARPDFAHSVHVEVNGLEPARWYHYRFRAGGVASPIGRTRTAPAPGAAPSALSFAFASCQHFERGLYTAYQHMAAEDIELVIFLGDYIYEGAATPDRVRQHRGGECRTLGEYRGRYEQYHSDLLLREARRLFPWIIVWDDHEVDNDWAGDWPEWSNPDPDFMTRRANAAKAFYEHMPLRHVSLPNGPNIRIHRRFDYGDLARFHMLDTRQFRSRQACGGGRKNCDEVTEASRTMLGAAQEQWLEEGLGSSRARWNIIGNQILMTKVDIEPGPEEAFAMDNWGGYEAARRRLTDFLAARSPSGPVVITGNNHHHFVGDLKSDFRNERAPTVATEFLGTAISSTGDAIGDDAFVERWKAVLAENPQAKYFLRKPGYVVCALDRETCRADFRVVPVISRPGAPLETSARFVVENHRPGAQRV